MISHLCSAINSIVLFSDQTWCVECDVAQHSYGHRHRQTQELGFKSDQILGPNLSGNNNLLSNSILFN